jgi:EAL domain-containing protein (putative c-di-GMP-specific phosphodiesterase class I)
LVDDHPQVLQFQVLLLTRAGFDVSFCTDGAEALRLLRYNAYDVVISDIGMPNVDGIQLLKSIKSRDPDLPVIIMTGGATIDTAIQAVEHGAFKYLTKPIEFERFLDTTKKAIQIQRLARAKREALEMMFESELQEPSRRGLSERFSLGLDSLWPAFQPIVRSRVYTTFGYEALLRTDEASMPHPECFLDAAHHLGRLRELGRVMRGAAVRQLTDEMGVVFLNLHPDDLNDPMLFDPDTAVSENARRIVLEVTERMALDSVPNVRDKVAALRRLGFRIAIDDLGAGFAGLSSFVSLEPEFVKLDMSLTRGIDESVTKQKLVSHMINLCRDVGMTVIAEGIETERERDVVERLGCDLLQGYYFGRPNRMPTP